MSDGKGIPLLGDRSAWDTVNYPDKHAKDVNDGTPIIHVPPGSLDGDIPIWDGTKWVVIPSTDLNPHDPVTIVDGTTINFTLIDQELTAEVIPSAIKLDDFGTPDDNTDLNSSTTNHGLLPKLSGVDTEFLNGLGLWDTPTGTGGGTGTKITELDPETSPLGSDLLVIVHDPGGTPVTEKATIDDVLALSMGHVIENAGTPVTQRSNLSFEGVIFTDDSANDRTIVSIGGGSDFAHNVDGALAVVTDIAAFVASKSMTINKVYLYGLELGSSSSTIVDIHKNGTTIFSTQANRPTLAYNDGDHVAISGVPNVISLVEGDVLTIDIDQVAVGSSGLAIIVAITSPTVSPDPYIGAELYNDADISLSTADQVLTFNTVLEDTDSIANLGTYPTRLTCQTAGRYVVQGNVSIQASSGTTLHQVYIMLNNTEVLAAAGGPAGTQLQGNVNSRPTQMEVGDYVELHVQHTEGGTIVCYFYATFAPTFSMHKVD